MSTKFTDGPAKGVSLTLQRAPDYLRVVRETGVNGRFDALDGPDDEAKATESVVAYRLVSHDGGGFLDYTDKATGRRKGVRFVSATYAVVDPQPDDATLRDNKRWQAWCAAPKAAPQPVKAPTNIRELLAYLGKNPRVRVHSDHPDVAVHVNGERTYTHHLSGRLYWRDDAGKPSFVPLDCTLTDAAAAAETGVTFRPDGFSVEKFGAAIHYTYLPAPEPS